MVILGPTPPMRAKPLCERWSGPDWVQPRGKLLPNRASVPSTGPQTNRLTDPSTPVTNGISVWTGNTLVLPCSQRSPVTARCPSVWTFGGRLICSPTAHRGQGLIAQGLRAGPQRLKGEQAVPDHGTFRIMEYGTFCVWLLSLSTVFERVIRIVIPFYG